MEWEGVLHPPGQDLLVSDEALVALQEQGRVEVCRPPQEPKLLREPKKKERRTSTR